MKKIVLLVCFCTLGCAIGAKTSTDQERFDYIPKLSGVIRARWEGETRADYSRFAVRNARVALSGAISPTIDYMVQADFCDLGKIKMLDAWGRLKLYDGLAIRAGQFLMPVSVEALRAPADYIFANRSFMGKQLCNARGVGAELSYRLPLQPLVLKAAAFNITSVADHNTWNRTVAVSGSVAYTLGYVTLCSGFQSTKPQYVRINIWDGSATWSCGRWLVEGEYMNKSYNGVGYRSCNAWSFFADYRIPIAAGMFNQLSFQGRFDGMTDHSSGSAGAAGTLVTDDPARNRVTVGSTISYIHAPLHADIRLNYEKYFYHHGVAVATGAGDKLVVEFVVKF